MLEQIWKNEKNERNDQRRKKIKQWKMKKQNLKKKWRKKFWIIIYRNYYNHQLLISNYCKDVFDEMSNHYLKNYAVKNDQKKQNRYVIMIIKTNFNNY